MAEEQGNRRKRQIIRSKNCDDCARNSLLSPKRSWNVVCYWFRQNGERKC